MSKWAARMHRRAATLGSVVTSCGHPGPGPYPHRLEKVKFGILLEEVCKPEIPGPLLVLILKLNKEAPLRKDVFRAPGNQTAIKQLIHFLQAGRLVNVDNYSVYTIASVLKKFLRKLPGGVFGLAGELELFRALELADEAQQNVIINRLIASLPVHTQQLLVLLFGTFRVIASNAARADTGMTSEALGVSVAPSFFHTCVSDGKTARMEDVLKFKSATKIMKHIIENFTAYDLFGRENYEYYARVTGRVLRVQDEWIFSFRYPPPPRGKSDQQNYALQLSLQTEKTWLQCECDRWGLNQEESQSTPALLTAGGAAVGHSAISLGIIPEHSLLESCARLSVSLEGPGIFSNQSTCSSSGSTRTDSDQQKHRQDSHHMTLEELRAVNRYAESTKSLSFLPQVHERQTARMRTRSEWFLGDGGCDEDDGEHDEETCQCGHAPLEARRSSAQEPSTKPSVDEMDCGGHQLHNHHHHLFSCKRPVTQLFETTSGFGIPESERERSGGGGGSGEPPTNMFGTTPLCTNAFLACNSCDATADDVEGGVAMNNRKLLNSRPNRKSLMHDGCPARIVEEEEDEDDEDDDGSSSLHHNGDHFCLIADMHNAPVESVFGAPPIGTSSPYPPRKNGVRVGGDRVAEVKGIDGNNNKVVKGPGSSSIGSNGTNGLRANRRGEEDRDKFDEIMVFKGDQVDSRNSRNRRGIERNAPSRGASSDNNGGIRRGSRNLAYLAKSHDDLRVGRFDRNGSFNRSTRSNGSLNRSQKSNDDKIMVLFKILDFIF